MATISLRNLIAKYTTADILREASKSYTLFNNDAISLLKLIDKIRNSPDNNTGGMDIVLMVVFWGKRKKTKPISYGGFQKNERYYRFTAKNCSDIEKIACCKVHITDRMELTDAPSFSEYLPQTELEELVIILLSINAFSPESVDYYFDGDAKNADSIAYIVELIKNNDSSINI